MTRKMHPYLAQHRSYSRLAAKAERAGQATVADHYRTIAAARLRAYHRAKGHTT